MSKVKFEWDGEEIKKQTIVEDVKLTPKDIIDGLHNTRHQITTMESQVEQSEQQAIAFKQNIKIAKEHEAKLKPLETKCIELQIEKLKLFIKRIHTDCMEKAAKSSKEVVAQDPSAYTEGSQKRIAYLDYQKLLATNPKVAERISAVILKRYLYENPIFDNPFLTTDKD